MGIPMLDVEGKATYSDTLLAFSRTHRAITACPVAFGEVSVKERVRSVLRYKQPALWVVMTVLIMGAAVALCFLTAPRPAKTAEAPAQTILSVSERQLQQKPDRDGGGKGADPEPEAEKAGVPMNLLMCVSSQCDVAE